MIESICTCALWKTIITCLWQNLTVILMKHHPRVNALKVTRSDEQSEQSQSDEIISRQLESELS